MKASEEKEDIKNKFFMHGVQGTVLYDKNKAQQVVTRKSEHYAHIQEYGGEIIKSNPGITGQVGVDLKEYDSSVFKIFYVYFKALRDQQIRGCRRVIGIDGCFLKG